MKPLSLATEQELITALAEIAGARLTWNNDNFFGGIYYGIKEPFGGFYSSDYISSLRRLLTSYDAIITLIQKQPDNIKRMFYLRINSLNKPFIELTPLQLAQALLVAARKFSL